VRAAIKSVSGGLQLSGAALLVYLLFAFPPGTVKIAAGTFSFFKWLAVLLAGLLFVRFKGDLGKS